MTLEERFWRDVSVQPEGCWEWIGYIGTFGYGRLSMWDGVKVSTFRTHRVSWELHNGPIPPNLCVLHKCDNRKCVRPDHLFIGTRADNANDRDRKGRVARGEKAGPSKLRADMIPIIRSKKGRGAVASLARQFGVRPESIAAVRKGKTWKHIVPRTTNREKECLS